MRYIFLILILVVSTSAVFLVPAPALAATPCENQPGILRDQTQDPSTKIWKCVYEGRPGTNTYEVDYLKEDGTPVMKNGQPKTETLNGRPPEAVTCSATQPSGWVQQCFWIPFMSILGGTLVQAGAGLLKLSSQLFNVLVQYVVVDFGRTLEAFGLNDGIAIGWTIFRDVTNMLVIGIFTFIAISIVLGLKEYGQKKLVANVLIVAMLLNFSLLFTKLVIDASNFTAYQIYTAISGTNASGSTSVADSFIKSMRVLTLGDSTAVVEKAAKESNSGWAGLFYGIVVFVLLVATALVMFYGVFIMAARGILFVLLMLISALAFASYLIPGMAQGEYGFQKWWKSLLGAAIFAPMFMLFLAVSLFVVETAAQRLNTNMTLGDIASNPAAAASSGAWGILWIYMLGIALLFLSIRLSSKFAGTVSGMGYVPGLFRNALAAPLALTAGRVVAPFMQRTLGARAYGRVGDLKTSASKANFQSGMATSIAAGYAAEAARLAKTGDREGARNAAASAAAQRRIALDKQSEAQRLLEKAAKTKEKADKTYNIMDSGMAKALNKAMGNAFTGESEKGAKGYASRVEERGKAAAKLADEAKLSDSQKKEIEENIRTSRAGDLENRRALHQAAQASHQAAEATLNAKKDAARIAKAEAELERDNNRSFIEAARNVAAANAAKADKSREHGDAVDRLMERINAASDPSEKQSLRDMLTQLQTNHATEIQSYDQRVREAAAEQSRVIQELSQSAAGKRAGQTAAEEDQADRALRTAKNEMDAAERNLRKATNDMNTEIRNALRRSEAIARDATGDLAAAIGYHEGGQHVADAARGALKKQRGSAARLKELLKDEGITGGGDSGGAAGSEGGATT